MYDMEKKKYICYIYAAFCFSFHVILRFRQHQVLAFLDVEELCSVCQFCEMQDLCLHFSYGEAD